MAKKKSAATSRRSQRARPRKRDAKIDSPLPRGLTVVGVGASAGGLEALTQLVESVPGDAGLALIVLQHMAPDHDSALPYLLKSHTKMTVVEVSNGVRVRANHVYVVPPNVQMELKGDHLKLSPRPTDRSRHTPIDTFFASMAATAGSRGIAVVLSGTASDGALGIRDVKAAGGITIAQRPESAKYDGMPRAAIATGLVDLILEPAEIGAELTRIGQHPYVRVTPVDKAEGAIQDAELTTILELLRPISGIDFRLYKQPTIRRRLVRRMALNRIEDSSAYIRLLRNNPQEQRALFQDLLIHVTRFFREPDSFAALAKDVFPKMVEGLAPDRPLRMWVCGCATGEEAYSLAMIAVEFLERTHSDRRMQIFATDVSETAIEHARAGVYPAAIAADVSPSRLRRFFTRTDGNYRVTKQIRDFCVFARQDLTKDPPFSRLDLIMCRNVLIYMDSALQKKLIGAFHYALNPHGFLVLGQAETVGTQASLFAMADKKHRIHRKKSVVAPAPAMSFPPDNLPPVLQRRRSDSPGSDRGVDTEANRMILDRYSPPGVVVDADLQIVQFRGQTGPFLEPAPGEASLSLLKMAREGLLYGLRTALHVARKAKKPVRREGIHVRTKDDWRLVTIEVIPLSASGRPYYLVLFDEAQPVSDKPAARRAAKTKKAVSVAPRRESAKMELLQRELAASRDYLQSIIQELEAANEELQSANEEILSSNEELQSTNEELDTAKEELQSTNEELNTVNEELHGRNDEISRVNSDLVNLLASVQIAIVIVGGDLRIRRFTPMAEKILNLIPGDVDRVIGHINPNIDCPNLEQLIVESMDSVAPIEREVRDKQDRWYSLRIRPYKSVQNKIEGAVLALFDIDQLKQSEQRAKLAQGLATSIVISLQQPAALVERDLRIRLANTRFAQMFGLDPADVQGRTLTELGGKSWRLDEWKGTDAKTGTPLPTLSAEDREGVRWSLDGAVVQSPEHSDGSLIMAVATRQ